MALFKSSEPTPGVKASEKINADRFARIPQAFGDGEFWKKYYDLAVKEDDTTTKRLTAELDILLLFAGLFCGINTAFIGFTIPMLSPAPTDDTNTLLRYLVLKNDTVTAGDLAPTTFSAPWDAIRINFLFAASLSCSLLAAFGAMLGKQWLSYADQTTLGRALHDLRGQAQQLQRDASGVKRWHFHSTVEALPLVLEIGLLAFWLGLLDFLWSLNQAVACVALAFAAAGFAFQVLTLIAAATDPDCPFRTPLSLRFLPELGRIVTLIIVSVFGVIIVIIYIPLVIIATIAAYALVLVIGLITGLLLIFMSPIFYASGKQGNLWMVVARLSLLGRVALREISIPADRLPTGINAAWNRSLAWSQGGTADDKTAAESVRWLLTQPADEEAPLLAAHNVLTLIDGAIINRLSFPHKSCARLLVQLRSQIFQYQFNKAAFLAGDASAGLELDDRASRAIVYGRAICHLLLAPNIPVKVSIDWAGTDPIVGDCVVALRGVAAESYPELAMLKLLWDEAPSSPNSFHIPTDIHPSFLPIYLATSMAIYHSGSRQLRQQRITEIKDKLVGVSIVGKMTWDERTAFGTLRALQGGWAAQEDVDPVWRWNRVMTVETIALGILNSTWKAPNVLNLIAWAMSETGRDEGQRQFRRIDGHWIENRWKAYTTATGSGFNLITNLRDALEAYRLHADALRDDRESLALKGFKSLSSPPFRKVYAQLLEAIRGLYVAEDPVTAELDGSLNDMWPKLLSTMEDILVLEGEGIYTPPVNDPTDLEDRLGLQQEVVRLMHQLSSRVQALTLTAQAPQASVLWATSQAVCSRSQTSGGVLSLLKMVQQCNLPKASHMTLFEVTPTAAAVFCAGLGSTFTELRIQTLRTIAAQAGSWLDADVAEKFVDVGFLPLLAKCIRLEEDWSAIATFLAIIMPRLATLVNGEQTVVKVFREEMEKAHAHGRLRLVGAVLYMWYKQTRPAVVIEESSIVDEKKVMPCSDLEDALAPLVQHVIADHLGLTSTKKGVNEVEHRKTYDLLVDQIPTEGQVFVQELKPLPLSTSV